MSAPTRALRRASIIFVALGSAASAVFLIWRFVSVEQIGAVPTVHLLGVLGLFVLPLATLAGLELDRRMAVRTVRLAGTVLSAPAGRANPASCTRVHALDGSLNRHSLQSRTGGGAHRHSTGRARTKPSDRIT